MEHLHLSVNIPHFHWTHPPEDFIPLYHSEVHLKAPLSHAFGPTTKAVARVDAEEARPALPRHMERDAAHRRDTVSPPEREEKFCCQVGPARHVEIVRSQALTLQASKP